MFISPLSKALQRSAIFLQNSPSTVDFDGNNEILTSFIKVRIPEGRSKPEILVLKIPLVVENLLAAAFSKSMSYVVMGDGITAVLVPVSWR